MKTCNDNLLARMAETPLFANLSESERKALMTELDVRIRTCARNELITHACEPASEVYVVLKGCISVYECGLKEDCRHLVYRLDLGDTYGASFPVLDLANNPGELMANGPAEVLLCKVARIRDLIRRGTHAAFVANLYAAAARQGFLAWRKLQLLSCYEIADRILLYLRWQTEGGATEAIPVTPSALAEYLGVNRTAFYRAITKLKSQKRITVIDGKLRLRAAM